MNDYEIQKIRDTAFCSGYNTAVSKYEKQNKELQEENAELKGLVNQYKASKCGSISLVNRNMIMFDQLTKAKEIIKDLLSCLYSVEYDRVSDLEQAEQFLNSEGK